MAREFEKELDAYISARKKKKLNVSGFIKKMMPKPSPGPVELPPEVQAYDQTESTEVPKIENVDVVLEDEYEDEQKTFLQKFLEWARPNAKEIHFEGQEKEEYQEQKIKEMVGKEMVMQDLKATAKIALYVIKQLPPEQLREFKNSSDFSELKSILKKHELIK